MCPHCGTDQRSLPILPSRRARPVMAQMPPHSYPPPPAYPYQPQMMQPTQLTPDQVKLLVAGILIIVLAVLNILTSVGLLMDVLMYSEWYYESAVPRLIIYGLLTLVAAIIGILCGIQAVLHRRFIFVLAGIVFMMVMGISTVFVLGRVPPAVYINLGLTVPALILILISRKGFDELGEDPPTALG